MRGNNNRLIGQLYATGILLAVVVILFILTSCVTQYPHCEGDQECIAIEREYARVEKIQKFRRMKAACEYNGNFIVFPNGLTRRLERALETGDYSRVHPTDLVGVQCVNGIEVW